MSRANTILTATLFSSNPRSALKAQRSTCVRQRTVMILTGQTQSGRVCQSHKYVNFSWICWSLSFVSMGQ